MFPSHLGLALPVFVHLRSASDVSLSFVFFCWLGAPLVFDLSARCPGFCLLFCFSGASLHFYPLAPPRPQPPGLFAPPPRTPLPRLGGSSTPKARGCGAQTEEQGNQETRREEKQHESAPCATKARPLTPPSSRVPVLIGPLFGVRFRNFQKVGKTDPKQRRV